MTPASFLGRGRPADTEGRAERAFNIIDKYKFGFNEPIIYSFQTIEYQCSYKIQIIFSFLHLRNHDGYITKQEMAAVAKRLSQQQVRCRPRQFTTYVQY